MTEHDPDFDDDDELELEPVDPSILEHKRERIRKKTREIEDSVDVEELYEQIEQGDIYTLEDFKKFRFNTRHLLIATALLAFALTLAKLTSGCMALFISAVLTVAAAWFFVLRKEKQQAFERAERRKKMEARIAAERAAADGKPLQPQETIEKVELPEQPQPSFKFSFSMKQLLGVFVFAAIALGLIRWVGGAENAALLLGFIALAGIVFHALGVDPPPIVVLGWWLLLVLYIFIAIIATFSPDDETAQQAPQCDNTQYVSAQGTRNQPTINMIGSSGILIGDKSFFVLLQKVNDEVVGPP